MAMEFNLDWGVGESRFLFTETFPGLRDAYA